MHHFFNPKRIAGHSVEGYEGVYDFYQTLQRRERKQMALKVAALAAVPVVALMSFCSSLRGSDAVVNHANQIASNRQSM